MNPWLLAAAVFGAIGLLTEVFSDEKDKPRILPAPPDTKKPAPVTVNVAGPVVKSPGKEPKASKKPPAKVPDKPSDG